MTSLNVDDDSRSAPARSVTGSRRVLAIGYSQSGDAAKCAEAFLTPLKNAGATVDYELLRPVQDYPFPWRGIRTFFNVMPDCIQGNAPEILTPEFDPDADYDLVVLIYQVWFLSPSLPLAGFLNHPKSSVLRGRKVVTIVVCRNMWMSAAERVHKRLAELGSIHLDNVVVTHQGPIWATFVTTPRLLLYGRRDRLWNIFPEPGVGAPELDRVRHFGEHLAAKIGDMAPNRTDSFFAGMEATQIEEKYILPELIGRRLFKFWAGVISMLGRVGGRFWRGVGVYLFVVCLVSGILFGIPLLFVFRLLAYPFIRPFMERCKVGMRRPSDRSLDSST